MAHTGPSDIADLPPYKYTPLSNSRCTRVIRLLPSRDRDAPLKIQLVEMSVDSPIPYRALSYTWGGQERDQPVTCDGGTTLLITANALSALRRLRQRWRPTDIWVDAICIDQMSTAEKNVQVPLMADIYSQASSVVVWLGLATADIEKAFDFMHVIRRVGRGSARFLYTWKLGASLTRGQMVLRDEQVAFEAGIRALSDDNSYWTRTWTIQELALNSSCLVYCGDCKPVSLDAFIKALHFVDDYLGPKAKEGSRNNRKQYVQACMMHYACHLRKQDADPDTLLTALVEKQAMNPRDLFYGNRAVYPQIFGSLPVSYESEVNVVFSQAVAAIMTARGDISPILTYACQRPKKHDLPSWVPDWTSINKSFEYFSPSSTDPKQVFRFSDDFFRLFVKGQTVDASLEMISDAFPAFPASKEEQEVWYDQLRSELYRWISPHLTLMKKDDAVVEALLKEYPYNPHNVRESGLFFETAVRSLLGPMMWMEYHVVPWLSGKMEEMRDEQREAMGLEMKKFAGQRLLMTRQGYIGLCPEVEVGDLVVYLTGCPTRKRTVLRPCGDEGCYKLVSEAEVREIYTQAPPVVGEEETVEYCIA